MNNSKDIKVMTLGTENLKSTVAALNGSRVSVLIVDDPILEKTELDELEIAPLVQKEQFNLPTKAELQKAKMDRLRKRRRR